MTSKPDIISLVKERLVVSCQAPAGDPFCEPSLLARFARAAVLGGAAAIRAEGPDSVRAIKAVTGVPVIGLRKRMMPDGQIMITPTEKDIRELADAGAEVIAIDCTKRGQRDGAIERIRWTLENTNAQVWADIATVDEAVAAAQAGAQAVLSTLRGYTHETANVTEFDPSFIEELVKTVKVPVIAEGRINTPEQALAAMAAGATSVVIGTAITRPEEITRKFVVSMAARTKPTAQCVVGIDLGGTSIKSGISNSPGSLQSTDVKATPSLDGREKLLAALTGIAKERLDEARSRGLKPAALGIATAGWVDPTSGRVLYATDNLPGWSGTNLGPEMERALGLPVFVENDGNALAVAERAFGLGRKVGNFVCLTFGTGVGGGCYIDGKLLHGAHFFANGIGHMIIERSGRRCTCGRLGCLETYTNAKALLEYGNHVWPSAELLIIAAHRGNLAARTALEIFADWVATGCISIYNVLDPDLIVLSGGLAQNNSLLPRLVEDRIKAADRTWAFRPMRIESSDLGYFGGVLGATEIARIRLHMT